jgi:biotin transport system substrate-specific component
MKKKTLQITQTALITSLIAVSAQIAIPFFTVPLTLQTFAVCLAGFLLGPCYGVASVLIYLSLGTLGAPVFAGLQGSFGVILGPTGGFLIGFLAISLFCGISSKNGFFGVFFPLFGIIFCHFLGILWFSRTTGNSFLAAFLLSFLPYLLKDILSCFLAKILSKKLKNKLFKQKNNNSHISFSRFS